MSKKKHGAGLIIDGVPIKTCEHDYEERCRTTGLTGEEIEQRENAETVYVAGGTDGHSGATSDAFREGWDRMFAKPGGMKN